MTEVKRVEREHAFKNKTICVFGGTGTVGSLIVEEVMRHEPKSVRVICNSENELWDANQKWTEVFRENKEYMKLRYIYGDIRDLERVRRALKDVEYCFNAAAMKHVPYCEYNPLEAVKTNIIGLDNVIQGCIENEVKKFLHVSTDKAVEPTTIMGNTKAIGEKLLQMRWQQNPHLRMICIRSGNIWNSRGSIMRLVEECKKQEIPVPITDKRMKRFFINPKELIMFLMNAFKHARGGEIWVPKMQEVKILDAIREGLPEDYPLVEIGRRKGEKLSEKLYSEVEDVTERETHWIIKSEVIT